MTLDQQVADVQSANLVFPGAMPCSPELPDKRDRTSETAVSLYENDVPEFVEAELIRLYGNFYSSLSHLKFRNNFKNASTYVDSLEGKVTTLFLFQREQSVVTVLNEVIAISNIAIERFSHYIFQRFHEVAVIRFRAIGADRHALPFPFQRYNYLEDIVINLPGSTQEYFSILGKSLRRNLKRCQKKLSLEHPSFSFHLVSDSAVQESDVRQIIALNKARMIGKKKLPAIDEEKTARLVTQVRQSGLVCIATVDGRICAGAICVRTGKNYFMTVIAHDPSYDVYSLGKLCCAQMICACIDRGGGEFHFLWGRYEYKFSLAGIQRDLYQIAIYRSRLEVLQHLRLALEIWIHALSRHAILNLRNIKKSNGTLAQLSMQFFSAIRRR